MTYRIFLACKLHIRRISYNGLFLLGRGEVHNWLGQYSGVLLLGIV